MTTTLQVVKQRFGLFVAFSAVTMVVAVAIGVGEFAVLGLAPGGGLSSPPTANPLRGGFGPLLALVVMSFVLALLQIKAFGMQTLLAYETALGRRPDLAALNAGTRGIVGRTITFFIIATVGLSLLAGILFLPVVMAAAGGMDGDPGAALGGFAVFALLIFLVWLAGLYLSVRWIYFTPALVIESKNGFGALGSSWRLTRGQFWRTLGWYLAGTLSVMMVVWIVSAGFGVVSALTVGRTGADAGLGVAWWVSMAVTLVLDMLMLPLLTAYLTVMYIDQQWRTQAPGVSWTPPPNVAPYGAMQPNGAMQHYSGMQHYGGSAPYPSGSAPSAAPFVNPQPFSGPQSPYGATTPGGIPGADPQPRHSWAAPVPPAGPGFAPGFAPGGATDPFGATPPIGAASDPFAGPAGQPPAAGLYPSWEAPPTFHYGYSDPATPSEEPPRAH